jgi:hypothetical protein
LAIFASDQAAATWTEGFVSQQSTVDIAVDSGGFDGQLEGAAYNHLPRKFSVDFDSHLLANPSRYR